LTCWFVGGVLLSFEFCIWVVAILVFLLAILVFGYCHLGFLEVSILFFYGHHLTNFFATG